MEWIFFSLLCFALSLFLFNSNSKRENLKRATDQDLGNKCDARLDELITHHLPVLARKRRQFVSRDDYGLVVGMDKWQKEIDDFVKNVIYGDSDYSHYQFQINAPRAANQRICLNPYAVRVEIDRKIDELGIDDVLRENIVSTMEGTEFEVYCAQLLEQDSWSVVRKGGSGDQGVDLIASLGQLRVAIQCKRYSQPVGNKAVQEVAAGRQFEQCDLAVVVSNADYTPSARQLGSALGVMLLHYSELASFRERVEGQFSALVSGEASM